MQRRSLALTTFVATAIFPAVIIVLNIIQVGHHDPLRRPASQLALGTDGWMMNVAFCALAVGTLVVAYLLGQTLGSYRALPVVLLIVAAIIASAFAFTTNPYWRAFQRMTAVWAVAAVFTFVLLLVLGGVGLFGLGERTAIAVWVAWLLAIAGRIMLKPSPTTGTRSPARA